MCASCSTADPKCWRRLWPSSAIRLMLELPRFRGHPNTWGRNLRKGVHDAAGKALYDRLKPPNAPYRPRRKLCYKATLDDN